MRVVLKPLPLLLACAGCASGGQVAREAATALERKGQGELAWLGGLEPQAALAAKARSRWPIVALDGCPQLCALAWLAAEGVAPQRCYMLAGMPPDAAAESIAAET